MAHEDAGHYAAKHTGGKIDPAVAEAIGTSEKEGRITCAAAHAIAEEKGCSPKQVGMNIDLLEKRISKCQLGLFGHGSKKGKAVERVSSVAENVAAAINEASEGGRITCEAAWKVADRLNVSKLDVGCACESMGVKVSACQLGAF
jgi:hypothetical protein